jgi:ubiquitin carboxyl-terminal hydrolase 8
MRGVSAPAPLHSRTQPWRGLVKVGDEIEVREVSSLPGRPKWFRGIVSFVAPANVISEIKGGAELEHFDVLTADGSKTEEMRPLLLLERTQQILVEVEQELENQTNPTQPIMPVPSMEDASRGILPTAQPPHVRWMSLYGEELCQLGTHTSQPRTKGSKPATITYAHDKSKPPVTVLGSFNDMHGQGFIRESIRGRPPAPGCVGLQNLGNSCFMNSIVQCMNQIDFLTRYFLKGYWKKEINQTNPLGSEGMWVSAYANLLADVWSNDYSVLAPRTLRKTIGLFAPQFNNIHQHDSEEFYGCFLDGIHEDLNRVYDKPYVETLECFGMQDEKAALETWRRHLLRHDSIIVDNFQGMYRSHVTCPKCGRESIKFDVFSTIPLSLASNKDGGPVSLEDCFEQLTMGEQLDENNLFYCSGCKKHVCALKMIALWSVPDVLVLQLKRFAFRKCDIRGGIVRSKLEDIIHFPVDTLDLRDHVLGQYDPEAPPVYKLFGVSEHAGSAADSGHYTATVLNSINKHWYRFNDSHVGASTGEASVTGRAYLLFYQRKKGSSRWGGMERIMTNSKIDPHGALETDVDGFTHVTKNKKKKRGAGGDGCGDNSGGCGGRRFAC